jgi:hypothetical protein
MAGCRWCIPVLIVASLATALGCIVAATGTAAADPQAPDLSGRWSRFVSDPKQVCRDASCRLSYDLVRCGEGWCGIEVKDDKECGRIALRLRAGAPKEGHVEFLGRFERAQGAQPFEVRATLNIDPQRPTANGPVLLSILGNTDGDFQPFRRTYPLHMVLARSGEAVCRGQPKVS